MMQSNLLITKIIVPSRRSDVLHRARLLDFLHEYMDRKLVLLSAAAGYGKTSLLVDFAHDTKLPVCWYSLDEGDQDLQVFMEYLLAALRQQFPKFGGRTLSLLREPERNKSLDAYVGALISDIHEQIDSLFVLVLDDYHLVEQSEAVNRFLDRLLYYLPENAHFILASRTIPTQLTLSRLTAQLEVVGLGTNDLRFTADEIRVLIQNNFGLEITPAIAEELAAQSEGWITGIVLTTPTLWRGLLHEWIKGYGPGIQLFDYLAGEVFLQQSAELQQFLMDTSVLAELSVEVCNELLGRTNAEAMLQLAEKRNLFVIRLQDAGFRYHNLFREFLQTRLRQVQAARYAGLLERAAQVYERRGKLDRAIEYWLAAKDFTNAARLILLVAEEYYERGRWKTLGRWLNAVSETVLRADPLLLLWRAIVEAEEGAMENAQHNFNEAIAIFERRGDVVNHARALITSARHDEVTARAMERCERAISILPEHEFLLYALGYRTIGALKFRAGEHEAALALLERASALAEIANQRFLKSDAETDLGGAYFEMGRHEQAERHLQTARGYWEQLGHSAKIANVLNSLAVLRYQRGELERALELLSEALKHAHQSGYLRVEAYVLASLGDVYRDQGRFAEALEAYTSSSEMAEKIRENYLMIFTRVAAADIWRFNQQFMTAEHILESALNAASLHDSNYEVGVVQLGLGALWLEQKETERAVRHLQNAARLLEQANAKRELGRAHFHLAHAAIQRGASTAARHHLRTLAELGKQLGEDQFIWTEARRTRQVLEFGMTRRARHAFFSRLLKRLDAQGTSPAPTFISLEMQWPSLAVYTLGEARVVMDEKPLAKNVWQTATTKELFFFFATHPQGWRKEQVMDKLWPDLSRGQANDLFHTGIYRIRRAIFGECLVFRNGLYELNPEMACWLDVDEFEDALHEAQGMNTPEEKIRQLERALDLYQGDFLTEVYADWCAARREQLRARFLQALAESAHLAFETGNVKRALELQQQRLNHDPLDEGAYRDLIRLYILLGNRAAAIQTFQQCVQRLKEELGVAPLPETLEMYRQLVLEG